MKNEHDGKSKLKLHRTSANKNQVQQLIITQLVAARPASLPLSTISRGILCLDSSYNDNVLLQTLQQLISEGSIIKISECGFLDRYQLADQRSTPEIINGFSHE